MNILKALFRPCLRARTGGIFRLALLAVLATGGVSADRGYFDVRLGGMNPKDVGKFSFLGGLTMGGYFDKLVSIAGSVDYYQTSYDTAASTQPNSYAFNPTAIDKSLTIRMLMFMLNARIDIPYQFGGLITPFAQIGAGYELAFVNSTSFGDLGLVIGGGARMPLGESSRLVLNTGYNISSVSKLNNDATNEKTNVSGFMLQLGISFDLSSNARVEGQSAVPQTIQQTSDPAESPADRWFNEYGRQKR
jgi:opacity protein-like surface antigen